MADMHQNSTTHAKNMQSEEAPWVFNKNTYVSVMHFIFYINNQHRLTYLVVELERRKLSTLSYRATQVQVDCKFY